MRAFLAEDILWHVGGKHPLSGDYRGVEAVLDYYAKVREQTGGTLTLEAVDILANDDHGGVFMRVRGERRARRSTSSSPRPSRSTRAVAGLSTGHWPTSRRRSTPSGGRGP
jgi:ketosteroid isomerase-like protein